MTINDLKTNEALIGIGIHKVVISAAVRTGDLAAAREALSKLKDEVRNLDDRVEELAAMLREPMGS